MTKCYRGAWNMLKDLHLIMGRLGSLQADLSLPHLKHWNPIPKLTSPHWVFIKTALFVLFFFVFLLFSPTAGSFGVSAQIGFGVVRGGPEARFHEGSTRVPRGFHEVLRGFREVLRGLRGGARRMLLGISHELIYLEKTHWAGCIGCL